MYRLKFGWIVFLFIYNNISIAQPKPSPQQLAWHDMEFNIFMHFGPNTFTGAEWGTGKEQNEVFNPEKLDCDQWCSIVKAAGAKGIIITAKHHDGFCLWPTKYSNHSVKQSSWRNGNGDVLKDLSNACKKAGLHFGVYVSPWDRNHPDYGTEKYNDIFIGMMEEVLTKYGPVFELWWDGANGEGPNGKLQVYDWKRYEAFVRKISPQTLIFSDIGPDLRWVGNENGIAGVTNYNTLNTAGFSRGSAAPNQDTLTVGNKNGEKWIPAECDVSIRPGWFYRDRENDKVKSSKEIFNLYCKSVNRGALLLLNVPPTKEGRIFSKDSLALTGFKKLKDRLFKNNLALMGKGYFVPHNGRIPLPEIHDGNLQTNGVISMAHLQSMGIEFSKPTRINTIVLRENLKNGQHCRNARLILMNKKHEVLREVPISTIGRKKMIRFPAIDVYVIALAITEQKGSTAILEIEAYFIADHFFDKDPQ